MQLREIHIDGFGIFSDARIRGLAPGINVLYGRNEFGKTTLLEFIRRVLFGFPTRSSGLNPYPALKGGRYGGRLMCQMSGALSPELTVSRTAGKGGGALIVSTSDGTVTSEDVFKARLGHVSDEFYRNVYAVSLQELQEDKKKQLQGEELRNRIYGAGLGLGQVSITELKKGFSDTAERLYKPRGSVQEMNEAAAALLDLERQIRQKATELAQYDVKTRERDGLALEAARLRELQRALQTEHRSLENRRSLYDAFVQMRDARTELAKLEEVQDIPDAVIEELRAKRQDVVSVEATLTDLTEQRKSLRSDLGQADYDPRLIERETDIKSLLSTLTQFREALKDLPLRQVEQVAAREQLNRGIKELGDGWNEERIKSFALTSAQKDALRVAEESLRAQQRAVEKARDRLEDYRTQTRATRSRPGLPVTYRIVGIAILSLGATACAYSAVHGNTIPAIVSGIAAALGLVVALSLGSASGPLRDRAIEELNDDLEAAARAHASATAGWSALIETMGLSPSLSPGMVSEQLRALISHQEALTRIEERQDRITAMAKVVESTKERLAQVATSLAKPLPTSDPTSAIEELDAQLDRAQEMKAGHERIRRNIEVLDQKIESLSSNLTEKKQRLAEYHSSFGASTPEHLAVLHERAAKKRRFQEDLRRIELTMQQAVGIGAPYEEFLAIMESTSPEEVRERLGAVTAELDAVGSQLEDANRRIGGLDGELKMLTSEDALLEMESKAEALRQQLRDSHRTWLRAQLALWAIEEAISKYETTRQPAVIRRAQAAFSLMTEDKYTTLVSPLDSSELHVRDSAGADRTVDELSRGTREQLYLAMRLGLIEQYEQNAEPLPVVMDDILVNFDDERGPLAVQALAEFARNRQVIVMTCHEDTREMYRRAGAQELCIERGPALL